MVLEGNNLFGRARSEGTRDKYLSIPPCAFVPANTNTSVDYSAADVGTALLAGAGQLFAPVILPHNATIISAVVFGNAGLSNESWSLEQERLDGAGGSGEFIGGSINVEVNANNDGMFVDNQRYIYTIVINDVEQFDKSYGARITYTT